MLTATKDNQPVTESQLYWSPEKKEIRNLLLQCHSAPKWVLTLGGMMLIDAKMFFRRNGYCHIISIERDPLIWQNQIKESEEIYHGITPLNMEFSSFIGIAGAYPPFDLINLDFNCIINKSLEQNLERFSPFLKSGSFMGITLVRAHDGVNQIAGTYCYETVCNRRYDFYLKNRSSVISQTIIALAKRSGRALKECERREYRNTGDKMPMLFLLYKVL